MDIVKSIIVMLTFMLCMSGMGCLMIHYLSRQE